ncbi:hypothetical protein QQS21_001644 [Conoideocrella luteorostrata]|uniref:Uncharacterized protein n=1 Tax=Conoideocrella luteorostrata TaxID=1105319 RepID=A0AAJ0CZK4_9HYPO|nr:hypothetical protein QQS21_001644 [Conoideocrella luteorostrata]
MTTEDADIWPPRLSGSGGDGGNGEEMGNDPDFLAPCDKSYHTLEDIEKDKSSIPSHCVEQYITTIQVAIMESSIKKYDSLLRDDYDHWFDAYEGYVKHQVPAQIDAFMATEEGQKYFTCTVTEKPNCCGSCRYFCKDEGEDGGCVRFPGCDASKVSTRDIKCPSRTAEFDALSVDYIANADYKLTDKDGFFRALSEKYGIDEAWIHFGEKHMRTALNCKYAQDIHKCADENDRKYHHYPLADFNDIHVYNPKDLISKSYSKLTQMRDDFKLMSDMGVFEDDMDWGDTVDGMQLPALSVEAAIDNMQHIADKGKEVEKQYREEFILNMVLGILFLVPFVGEAAGSAGMTAARTLCRLISEAGDLGMAVYGVVHDPQNAYSAVFGYVLGKAVDRVSVGKAAGARRDMKGRDLDNLGAMKAKIGRIEDVRGCLCKL